MASDATHCTLLRDDAHSGRGQLNRGLGTWRGTQAACSGEDCVIRLARSRLRAQLRWLAREYGWSCAKERLIEGLSARALAALGIVGVLPSLPPPQGFEGTGAAAWGPVQHRQSVWLWWGSLLRFRNSGSASTGQIETSLLQKTKFQMQTAAAMACRALQEECF